MVVMRVLLILGGLGGRIMAQSFSEERNVLGIELGAGGLG
jgi:hypothetical protein